MSIDVSIEDGRWEAAGLEALAERACAAVFDHLALDGEDVDVSVLGCDDARIMILNADFRQKDKATNVLSWPSAERAAAGAGEMPAKPEPDAFGECELGDIAISYDTCVREADEAGKSLADHATHLLVHGILHLLGFDHERDLDATLMEGMETEILGKMGIADPYREDV